MTIQGILVTIHLCFLPLPVHTDLALCNNIKSERPSVPVFFFGGLQGNSPQNVHVVRLPLISAVLVVVVPVVPLLSNSALYFADAASSQVCLSSGSNCANFILRIISTRTYISHRLVPEQIPFKHSCEGPDDMPAHAKVIIRLLFLMIEKTISGHRLVFLGPTSPCPSVMAESPLELGR